MNTCWMISYIVNTKKEFYKTQQNYLVNILMKWQYSQMNVLVALVVGCLATFPRCWPWMSLGCSKSQPCSNWDMFCVTSRWTNSLSQVSLVQRLASVEPASGASVCAILPSRTPQARHGWFVAALVLFLKVSGFHQKFHLNSAKQIYELFIRRICGFIFKLQFLMRLYISILKLVLMNTDGYFKELYRLNILVIAIFGTF